MLEIFGSVSMLSYVQGLMHAFMVIFILQSNKKSNFQGVGVYYELGQHWTDGRGRSENLDFGWTSFMDALQSDIQGSPLALLPNPDILRQKEARN